jgi:single-stranded-DNA-specific exonuclease
VKIWKLAPVDDQAFDDLVRCLSLPKPVVRALVARHLTTPDTISAFLNPNLAIVSDPFDLPGMEMATDRIWQAIEAGDPIVIHGDYDVDGITATALLVHTLNGLGARRVIPCLPNRLEEGYGLSVGALEKVWPTDLSRGAPLILTADCGTGAHDAVNWAAQRGSDVIVTDHHEITGTPASARVMINPKLYPDSPHANLAGVGVAFKLCHALVKRGRQKELGCAQTFDLRRHLDLVALGTIADVVPLVGENRILVTYGLKQLNEAPSVGLQALTAVARLRPPFQAGQIGFALAPRLNAAGRMGDPSVALELLLTTDPGRARELAEILDRSNRVRQETETQILKDALLRVDGAFCQNRDFGVIVGGEGWHQGVIGIVASRLSSKYGLPSAVVSFNSEGEGRGSCRSIAPFDLVKGLTACASHLESFGGHAMAAGFTVRKDRFDAFCRHFSEVCRSALQALDLRPIQTLDSWIDSPDEMEGILGLLPKLGPFGAGNPEPVWGLRGVRRLGAPKILKDKHLKLQIEVQGTSIDAIAFGQGHREVPPNSMDVAFTLEWNTFYGDQRPQLNIKDFKQEV